MVDAPDRIWTVSGKHGLLAFKDERRGATEYVRADVVELQLAEARAATEKMHHRAQVAEGKIQSARASATEQIEVLASAAKQLGHWPAGSHWAKRAMERWIKATDVATEAERDRLAAEVARLRSALTETADALESRLTDDEKTANIRKPYEHPLSAYDRARAALRALQAQEERDG